MFVRRDPSGFFGPWVSMCVRFPAVFDPDVTVDPPLRHDMGPGRPLRPATADLYVIQSLAVA